jgi:hypothetical protein
LTARRFAWAAARRAKMDSAEEAFLVLQAEVGVVDDGEDGDALGG